VVGLPHNTGRGGTMARMQKYERSKVLDNLKKTTWDSREKLGGGKKEML